MIFSYNFSLQNLKQYLLFIIPLSNLDFLEICLLFDKTQLRLMPIIIHYIHACLNDRILKIGLFSSLVCFSSLREPNTWNRGSLTEAKRQVSNIVSLFPFQESPVGRTLREHVSELQKWMSVDFIICYQISLLTHLPKASSVRF